MSTSFVIRQATPDDASAMVQLILALAAYEKLSHEATPEVDALRKHLSPESNPRCEALVAEDSSSGDIVGMALYYFSYSTFLTRWGLYLEDLFVQPAFRGQGVGFALLKRLAQLAISNDCYRLEWVVLDWNELAINFYEQIGAESMKDWNTMRLSGEALIQLGSSSSND